MLVKFLIHSMHVCNKTLILFSVLIYNTSHCLALIYNFLLILFINLIKLSELL